MNQKGGVKKINLEKTASQSLYDMIESDGAIIRVLADGSRKCFVFELTVDPNYSEYQDLNQSGRWGHRVVNYILKICITDTKAHLDNAAYDLHIYDTRRPNADYDPAQPVSNDNNPNILVIKEAETRENIVNEARTQQTAWINTASNGRTPVCPSVADIIFFDLAGSRTFIEYLRRIFAAGSRDEYVCIYIHSQLTRPDRKICTIVMPEVGPVPLEGVAQQGGQLSTTLGDFIDKTPIGSVFQEKTITQADQDRALSLICSSVLRLFLAGIIHIDLHVGNYLVYFDENDILQGKIIDLGNSCIFTDESENMFLNEDDKTDLIIALNGDPDEPDLYHNFKAGITKNLRDFNRNQDAFNQYKTQIVTQYLREIQQSDTKGNQRAYPDADQYKSDDPSENNQMSWLTTDVFQSPNVNKILIDAYDISQSGFTSHADTPGISAASLRVAPYLADFNNTAIQDNTQWPTHAGGGYRKQTRRKHKFRKNKTKRLTLRKTKNKKRRRTSKK